MPRNVKGITNINGGHLLDDALNKISIRTNTHIKKGTIINDRVIFAFALILICLFNIPLNIPTIVITTQSI